MDAKLKQKTIISIVLFVVIFGGLLAAATFTDLQVSQILTKNALPEGEYLATDFFGVLFEIVGSSPVYLLVAFCALVLFWYFYKTWKIRPLKEILSAIFLIVVVVAYWFFVKDICGYILEHAGNKELNGELSVVVAQFMVAIILAWLSVLASRNIKEETVKKLIKFVFAALIAAIIANLIINFVKTPVGRMRYRAMNASDGDVMQALDGTYRNGGFSNYTRWYVMTDNNALFDSKAIFGVSDAFKSFPSGHTCAAGMSYAAIMLIDVLDVKSKAKKFWIWFAAIVWTGLTAISRIVVGAHFFSDVLLGGTIAFISMMLMRELIVCKCSHFKALFGKKSKKVASEEVSE